MEKKSKLEQLTSVDSREEFASLLGYKEVKKYTYVVYRLEDRYKTFSIPKKNGDERIIYAPREELKKLQKRLANLLNDCYEEIYRSASSTTEEDKDKAKNPIVHAFRKKHSIFTNASYHKGKKYAFNIDLKDFFPSINFGRVRGFFIKNRHFLLPDYIATDIANIACFDNILPQGSPLSPVISNFIGSIADTRLVKLAKKHKCRYTRYADDISFSTYYKNFPKEIAIVNSVTGNWECSNELETIIKNVGFGVNHKKTNMQYAGSRQIVTGLVVNDFPNVRIEYYRKVRAMCHHLFKYGTYWTDSYDPSNNEGKINLNYLTGMLGYIYQIKLLNKRKEGKENQQGRNKEKINTGLSKLYKMFIVYKYIWCLDRSLVFTEGKTDVLYLKKTKEILGIKSDLSFHISSNHFSSLFGIKKSTMGADELVGLLNRMLEYEKSIRDKMGEKKQQYASNPIIFLFDNDVDFKKETGTLNKQKIKIPRNAEIEEIEERIFYLFANIYILIIGEKNQEIEDLIPEETKEKILDGKRLNKSKNANRENEMSKSMFAKKFYKSPNITKEDVEIFSKGFFTKIETIEKDYSKKALLSKNKFIETLNISK